LEGAMAQEESIFQRSNCFAFLDPTEYPLKNNQLFYSKGVTVIKDENLQFLELPRRIDVISCAAVNRKNERQARDDPDQVMKSKIRAILSTAIKNETRNIVLGAFGCGVYGNDPDWVATQFKQELDIVGGYFETISFSILDDRNGRGNFAAFKKVFL